MPLFSLPKIPPGQRYRSVPFRKEFVAGIFWTVLFYISLVAVATALTVFAIEQDKAIFRIALIISLGSFFMWVFSLIMRRRGTCPLCKAHPLFESRARKHKNARKAFPANYAHTAVISILFTQRFNCMYCGSYYDLQRKSKELLNAERRARLKEAARKQKS